jgi:xanthine dehydrogenase iron-sulfur cluster and FAD-binding subunit A
VTTIESVPDSDPVKQAFVAHDAMQCGFCTPGFVMSCKGFLAENPKPTADDLLRGLSGNVCRCGSYAGILAALNQLAAAAPTPSAKRHARSALPRSKAIKAAGAKRRPAKVSGSKGH